MVFFGGGGTRVIMKFTLIWENSYYPTTLDLPLCLSLSNKIFAIDIYICDISKLLNITIPL